MLPVAALHGLNRAIEDNGEGFGDNAFALMLGCGLLATVGVFYWTSGMTYQLDAVNIYNDGVDARPAWPPPQAPQLPSVPLHQGPPGS